MKTPSLKHSREQGSALLITLTLGVILLIGLTAYLMLLGTQKKLGTRSQSWNAALTMAEAGIEEGLAQANSSTSIFTTNTSNPDFSNNGWGTSGSFYGPVNRNLQGGFYSVVISQSAPPTIYATGYVTVPISGDEVSRTVRVTTAAQGLFIFDLGAVDNINFNGNGVASDSYNSHDTNLSTGGQYDSSKTSTNGSIASKDGLVDLGNHTIDGSLYLGPTASYAGNGTVSGSINYNYNVQFPDVTLPSGASSWPTMVPLTVKISNKWVTYYDFTTSGSYILSSDYPITVESGININLNVTSTTFSPTSLQIHGGVTNSGTAKLYINGPTSVSISGNTAIDASNRPENLWYFGLPTLTSITYGGNSMFVGVIYAPEANLTLNGGGNASGIQGASVSKTITMNGHYNFHYDESLATNGPTRGFVVTSWTEL